MSLTEWTFYTDGSVTGILDTAIKYAGNSSYRMYWNNDSSADWGYLTHDTFLEPQASITVWTRWDRYIGGMTNNLYANMAAYGNLSILPSGEEEWQKFKATYWYDAANNVKWGRVEKGVDSAWVQQGNDTNFGAGSPAASSFSFRCRTSVGPGQWAKLWFDELEVIT